MGLPLQKYLLAEGSYESTVGQAVSTLDLLLETGSLKVLFGKN
jgi:hypothetical protein